MLGASRFLHPIIGTDFLVSGMLIDFSNDEVLLYVNWLLINDGVHNMLEGKISSVMMCSFLHLLYLWTRVLDISRTPS